MNAQELFLQILRDERNENKYLKEEK
jgi:hypothetical protein